MRRPYQKPQVTQVVLHPNDTVLVECKRPYISGPGYPAEYTCGFSIGAPCYNRS